MPADNNLCIALNLTIPQGFRREPYNVQQCRHLHNLVWQLPRDENTRLLFLLIPSNAAQ
jgi:hypothetical protein